VRYEQQRRDLSRSFTSALVHNTIVQMRMLVRIAQLLRYPDRCPEAQDAVVKHALSHRALSVELQRIADMMSPAVFGHDLSIRFSVFLMSSNLAERPCAYLTVSSTRFGPETHLQMK